MSSLPRRLLMAATAYLARRHTAVIRTTAAGELVLRSPPIASDFRLLGDLESVIDLDAEIPHG